MGDAERMEHAANVMMRCVDVMARIARFNAEWTSMIAANTAREDQGQSLTYDEQAFAFLADVHGLGSDDVIATLRDREQGDE